MDNKDKIVECGVCGKTAEKHLPHFATEYMDTKGDTKLMCPMCKIEVVHQNFKNIWIQKKTKISFPKSFPNVSKEDLLKPISEFEKEHGIKGYIFDRSGHGLFIRETKEQYIQKLQDTHKKFIKMVLRNIKRLTRGKEI